MRAAYCLALGAGDRCVHAGRWSWRNFSRSEFPCCFFLRFPNATRPASKNSRAKRPACSRFAKSPSRSSTRRSRSICSPSYGPRQSRASRTCAPQSRAMWPRISPGRAPVPAIQLVQAPVFYGYAFAAYAEFASPVAARATSRGVCESRSEDGRAGRCRRRRNVSVAGESEIHMARIEADPNIAGGVWIWGVADNLRLAATNAVRIAEELVAKSSE